MREPQSFKNHGRLDPPFHFFVLPMLLANFVNAIVVTVKHWPADVSMYLWYVFTSFALVLGMAILRSYALKAQDRIIRLEERMRMAALGVPTATAHALTEKQLVALRFASDGEMPGLAARAAGMTPKQIKESITSWRADNFRV